MKIIHIHRHAKSSWKNDSLSDHDRPLNERGKINAKFMSALFAKSHSVDLLISSTAKRALATAKHFAKALGKSEDKIDLQANAYAASPEDLMKIINAVDNKHGSLMIFAHNPGLSDLANYLDHSFSGSMVTCARTTFVFEVDSWRDIGADSGQLVAFDYPRKYPEMADL